MNLSKKIFAALAAVSLATAVHAAPHESSDLIPAKGGNIRITPKFHGSLQIEYRGKVIVVDPVSAASWTKKADIILITHPHGDHFDLAAIANLQKATTSVTGPASIASGKIKKPFHFAPIKNGDAHAYSIEPSPNGPHLYTVYNTRNGANEEGDLNDITVAAVPAYNLVRGPQKGKKFHTKGEWNGYVLTLGGKRIYIAGDTEATPEMKALKNIDIAFLPMNLPFTMTPQEAAQAAKAFKPKMVYPYHYRYPFDKANNNPQQFAAALRGTKIQVRLRTWYPDAAVKKMMKK